jgi:transcription initiation factor TFIIIB Brf1 subunit/transcription initiation factor TFIIB
MTELTKEERTALWQDIAAKVPWPKLKKKYNLADYQVDYYKNPEREKQRSWNYQTKPEYIERIRREALEQVLDRFAKNPFVKKYYDEILEESLRLKAKGKLYSHPYIIAVATYGLLRKKGIPHTFDEVVDSYGADPHIIGKVYKKCYSSEKLPQVTVPAFIQRYATEFEIPENISTRALELNKQYDNVFAGRTPHHVALYWLYHARMEISGDEKLAKVSFIKKCDVSLTNLLLMNRQLEEILNQQKSDA